MPIYLYRLLALSRRPAIASHGYTAIQRYTLYSYTALYSIHAIHHPSARSTLHGLNASRFECVYDQVSKCISVRRSPYQFAQLYIYTAALNTISLGSRPIPSRYAMHSEARHLHKMLHGTGASNCLDARWTTRQLWRIKLRLSRTVMLIHSARLRLCTQDVTAAGNPEPRLTQRERRSDPPRPYTRT